MNLRGVSKYKPGARLAARLTVSFVALVVAVGIVYATIPDSLGVIHGCYVKSTGTLRVIDSSLSRCKAFEHPLKWSVIGPQGPPGPAGPGSAAFAADSGFNPIFIGDESTEIVSLNLGAGSYVFTGKVVVGDTTASNVIICSLFNDGMGGGPSILDTSQTPTLAAANFSTLPLVGSLTLTGNATISITCAAQNAGSPLGQFAHLNAMQVATLQ